MCRSTNNINGKIRKKRKKDPNRINEVEIEDSPMITINKYIYINILLNIFFYNYFNKYNTMIQTIIITNNDEHKPKFHI